jgi:hypothetical protein
MKRVALVVILALTLPLAAWANSSTVRSGNAGEQAKFGSLNRTFPDGVLFSDKFSGPSNGTAAITLGVINHRFPPFTPTLGNAIAAAALSNGQLQASDHGKPFTSSAELGSGAGLVTVPELGTLGLLGSGLLVIAGLIRRQLKNRG